MPVSATACGEPVTLSVKVSEALKGPVATGLNTTETEQLLPAGKVLAQLVVSWNEDAFAPVTMIPEMFNVAVPGFCTAICCAALEVPTFCVAKAIAEDEKEMSGVGGAMVNLTAFEVPPPGAGFVTVISTVPLAARLAGGTVAVNAVFAT